MGPVKWYGANAPINPKRIATIKAECSYEFTKILIGSVMAILISDNILYIHHTPKIYQ